MDSVALCERLFAPSENVSVKLNTVNANVVFSKETFAQSKPKHFKIRGKKALKLGKKNNRTKRNQEIFRIDQMCD